MSDKTMSGASLDRLETLNASEDYEAIRSGLSEVIGMLEQPGLGLNESVRAYEVGRLLADRCQQLLDQAELRITQLDAVPDGSGLPPF